MSWKSVIAGADSGTVADMYSDRFGIWREFRDEQGRQAGWYGYRQEDGRYLIRTWDTAEAAGKVASKLQAGPNTIAGMHVRFYVGTVPNRILAQAEAGEYQPLRVREYKEPEPEDWVAEEARLNREDAWYTEHHNRRD